MGCALFFSILIYVVLSKGSMWLNHPDSGRNIIEEWAASVR